MLTVEEWDAEIERITGRRIRSKPIIFAKALRSVYAEQVAHKDFRKILREMED